MINLGSKRKVLIVDDEEKFTRFLKLNFHHTGQYTAEVVNDAANAISAADRFSPDVILLDVMMPGMDGGEVASRLHATEKFKNTPILFLTAAIKKQEVTARHGVVGGIRFLAKPIEFQDVLDEIEKECQECRTKHVEQ